MKHSQRLASLAALTLVSAAGCGGDEQQSSNTLEAAWTFESGDCDTNAIETVRVVVTPDAGDPLEAEFDCEEGSGEVGEIGDEGGTFAVLAEGLDADGEVLAESLGQSITFSEGSAASLAPIDITLRPKPGDVHVTWSTASGMSCPPGVILPYFITLYPAPAEPGGELTGKVAEAQETCSSGEVILPRIAPGDYVVEVDSRAVTPALRGTAEVTVEVAQTAEVAVDL